MFYPVKFMPGLSYPSGDPASRADNPPLQSRPPYPPTCYQAHSQHVIRNIIEVEGQGRIVQTTGTDSQ